MKNTISSSLKSAASQLSAKKSLKDLASNIAKKTSELNNFYTILGTCTAICAESSYHRSLSAAHILAYFALPIQRKQFKIYYKNTVPVAIVTWAYLSEEIAKRYAQDGYVLEENDYKSGDSLWVTEFVVAKDDAKIRQDVIQDLRKEVFKGSDVNVIVRNDDDSVKKIFVSKADLTSQDSKKIN